MAVVEPRTSNLSGSGRIGNSSGACSQTDLPSLDRGFLRTTSMTSPVRLGPRTSSNGAPTEGSSNGAPSSKTCHVLPRGNGWNVAAPP